MDVDGVEDELLSLLDDKPASSGSGARRSTPQSSNEVKTKQHSAMKSSTSRPESPSIASPSFHSPNVRALSTQERFVIILHVQVSRAYSKLSIAWPQTFQKLLTTLTTVINDLRKLLLDVRLECDPDVYYNSVRPWFRGQDSDTHKRKWVFEGLPDLEREGISEPLSPLASVNVEAVPPLPPCFALPVDPSGNTTFACTPSTRSPVLTVNDAILGTGLPAKNPATSLNASPRGPPTKSTNLTVCESVHSTG
ncbi:hypothetical protein PM082_004739 [Marasmius tenuissimus]|nr:hypothetical protein PM082_004739 [Marasmius tenuissimus]